MVATNKDHKFKIMAVKKWEKEFNCNLSYDISGADVVCLRCVLCKRWEKRMGKENGKKTKDSTQNGSDPEQSVLKRMKK